MKFDTIYKRTNGGKIQEWTIEVQDNKFRTISGQTDGKKVTSEWTEVQGKNVGRSNETTAAHQAMKEAESKFKKQLEKHYHLDIKDCDQAKFVKVMLAHKYEKFDGVYPAWSQPKLDGIRCVVNKDGMWTRGGKPILSAPHVHEALRPTFDVEPDLVFDGELYAHKLKDNFNKIISLAKKAKPKPEEIAESAEHLEYWMYDIVSSPKEFVARTVDLEAIVKSLGQDCLVYTPTEPVYDQEELDALYGEYLNDGMEGQMIRKGDSLYENKRSKFLLKRKEFVDEEFEIISLNEGKGNYSGMIKSVTLTDGTVTFDSGIKGAQDFLKDLMDKAAGFVGKQATVRFQNKTPDNIPRFPVVYVLHEEERW